MLADTFVLREEVSSPGGFKVEDATKFHKKLFDEIMYNMEEEDEDEEAAGDEGEDVAGEGADDEDALARCAITQLLSIACISVC